LCLNISQPHDLPRRSAVAGATDAARRIEEPHVESERSVQPFHAIGRLVHDDHRAVMPRQKTRGPLLIPPAETSARVLREWHIVRRIGIYEIASAKRQRFDITGSERPASQRLAVRREVAR
jgi:hypothetical protein